MLENFDPETNGESKDIVAENIAQLKQLFPEVFTEDKVDFTALRAALGEYVETSDERYSFTWHGKAQAKRIGQTSSTGTLRPCREDSKNWDTTQNLFIEGDNLEVLKLLQKAYHKQVKMIYIDPPYNTGNEFIYPDNYQDNLDTYLDYTGQKDSEGRKFGTNTETGGRYHTNWLNMMYPRLKVAKNLLKKDGVIAVSIDEYEYVNLVKMMDEIYGPENALATFVWKTRQASGKQVALSNVSTEHEYIVLYGSNSNSSLKGVSRDESTYANPDNDPRGIWAKHPLDVGSTREERPNCFYDLVDPETGNVYPANPNRVWAFAPETMNKLLSEGKILFHPDAKTKPYLKKFFSELKSETKPISTWLDRKNFDIGYNTEGTKTVNKLFDNKKLFDYPKPVSLVKLLIEQVVSEGDIVLDFFAGSATTAHAAMKASSDEQIRLRYIMVQLPEPIDPKSEAYPLGYSSIADISKERIRRAGELIKADRPEQDDIDMFDIGFKVFKLDSSNIKPWDTGFEHLESDLYSNIDNIKADRSPEDVLYELLLKFGIDLTIPIENHTVSGRTIHSVGLGALLICLDDDITLDIVESIGKLKEELQPETVHVVLKDAGLKDDVVKTNAIQLLKRYDINDVKTL